VPVIAIFTKFEWQVKKQFGELAGQKISREEKKKQAYEKACQYFEDELVSLVQHPAVAHPPACCVRLQSMFSPILWNSWS